jgi:hypothetical protein
MTVLYPRQLVISVPRMVVELTERERKCAIWACGYITASWAPMLTAVIGSGGSCGTAKTVWNRDCGGEDSSMVAVWFRFENCLYHRVPLMVLKVIYAWCENDIYSKWQLLIRLESNLIEAKLARSLEEE